MTLDLCTTRLAVTGGSGLLGRAVLRQLTRLGCRQVAAPRSGEYDLRTEDGVRRWYADLRPDVVLHLAAAVGGIGANRDHPGRFFYDNAIMGLHMIEFARRARVTKLVCIGTVCGYPRCTAAPFVEADLWEGYPEETNAPYGLAKKMLLVQSQAYRREYGLNSIHLIPVNLYGPHDNFALDSAHVIPALIRKCVEARRDRRSILTLWGDGTPTREFLYVDDAAEGVVQAARHYDHPEPVNLGSGEEIAIRDLAQRIAALTGYAGGFEWDASRPNGQPRRCVDTTRARGAFGFEARTRLDEGLRRTCEWYLKQTGELADNIRTGATTGRGSSSWHENER